MLVAYGQSGGPLATARPAALADLSSTAFGGDYGVRDIATAKQSLVDDWSMRKKFKFTNYFV